MKLPVLKSNRLLLRPPVSGDAPAMIAVCCQLEVSQNLARVPHPYPADSSSGWIERQAKGLAGISYALTLDDRFIGIATIKPSSERNVGDFVPSIGYWLDPAFWGKGYMTEALTALLDWYMPLEPTERMRASVFEDNPGSRAVLQKLGFTEIGRGIGYSLARDAKAPEINLELTAQHYSMARQAKQAA